MMSTFSRSLPLLALGAALAMYGCSDDSSGPAPSDGVQASVDGGGGGGGGGGVGDPCISEHDCSGEPGTKECYQTIEGVLKFPGGFCSENCHSEPGEDPDMPDEVDCGEGGCLEGGSSGGAGSMSFAFCSKRCMVNEDCRVAEGYICYTLIPGFPGLCFAP